MHETIWLKHAAILLTQNTSTVSNAEKSGIREALKAGGPW